MIICELLTPITLGDGTDENPTRFQIMDDYPVTPGETIIDQTDRAYPPAEPLTMVVWCKIEQAKFDAISADSTYFVLWDTPNPKPPDEMPAATEFGLLRAYLAIAGFSQAWIKDVIGNDPNAYTRAEIAELLIAALRIL